MTRRTSAVVWIALGMGSGVVGESVGGPPAWIPAAVVIGASLRLGVPGGVGVAAAVFSGRLGVRANATCTEWADPESRWLRGFATEAAAGPQGAVQFKPIPGRGHPTRGCAKEILVYQHQGKLRPGQLVEIRGARRPDRRGRSVFVADSVRTSTTRPTIRARVAPFLVRFRLGLDARIQRVIGPAASPMAMALVSGQRSDVSRSVRDDFSRAGTAHLLAISGFHVGVIGGLFALGAGTLGAGPRMRSVAAVFFVWSYVAMIGWPASGVRAAGLLTAIGIGRLLGRPTQRLPALAVVFLLCLLLRPEALSGVGFQLSFAASLGIVLSRTWPDRCWSLVGTRVPRLAGQGGGGVGGSLQRLCETTVRGASVAAGATLPTVPLVAWHFGAVSLVSVPATLCSMPLAAASIVAVLAAVATDAVIPMVGPTLGAGAAGVLKLLELSVHVWARLPFAAVPVSGPSAVTLALAGLLVLGVVRSSIRWVPAVAVFVMIGASARWLIQGWQSAESRDTVELIFIDVGQGDATLIRTPGNRWSLVDAGPANRGWDAGLRRVAPVLRRLGVQDLETLVLTHADADHVGGAAAVLRRFTVHTVVDPGAARGTEPFIAALEEAERGHVPWRAVRAGERWELDGVQFEVLSPESTGPPQSTNEESVVVLVRYGRFEALLTGDASTQIERKILGHLPDSVEVLKVGHHGSLTSTASELLASITPQLAVISVGAGNRYGHPAPGVTTRLRRYGARILRTDRHGTIGITGSSDGSFEVTTVR